MITIWQDLRYGARTLLRTPGFTLIAVLTLALGIGANTAIFSVVNAALIRALPYHNPNRLVMLFAKSPDGQRDTMSIQEMREFQAQSQSMEDLTGFITQSVNLTGGDRPDRVRGAFVTANYFQVFGLEPIVGRMFAPGEDGPGAEKVVVVSEKIWRERLGGQGLTGKKLILNGEPFNVIGVAPSGFRQPLDPEVEVWMGAATFPGYTARRDFRNLVGIGHLKPGASLAQAQSEMNAVANQFAMAYPEENAGRGAGMEYFHDFLTGSLRRMLYLLFATVGVILLIACANLANLLLARGMARRREIALRAALGAGKWRLIRQLLTEASLLSLAGGGLGLLLAQWGLTALQRLPQNFVRDQAGGGDIDGLVVRADAGHSAYAARIEHHVERGRARRRRGRKVESPERRLRCGAGRDVAVAAGGRRAVDPQLRQTAARQSRLQAGESADVGIQAAA
jgi:putative ABC transport system permease protein